MRFAFTQARVLLDGAFADGVAVAVVVEGDRIAAVLPERDLPADIAREALGGDILAPGFIDTQVNGGGGALFNDDPSVETIRVIGAAHARYGTTGFLPTLISDDLDVSRAGTAAVDAAIAGGASGVLGIHIEGPFINRARKGIHAADRSRALDEEGLAARTSSRRGRTLVTVAPECGAADQIRRLTAAGVTIAAGHTEATHAEVVAAIDAGLTGFTHLFNAMSQLGNREPGVVGAALADPRAWCSLIVDGFHVSPVTLGLALRCKPLDRFLLVTDAMPSTGATERDFTLQGRAITARDGKLMAEDGTLAGSYLDMLSAVRNAHRMLNVPLEAALAMASEVPARFLGLAERYGRIAPGMTASLVAITPDLAAARVWIDGVARPGASRPQLHSTH